MHELLQGFDRTSLTVGFVLGGIFTACTGIAVWYIQWTWGRLKRPFVAQREVRDINKESWETFRSGGVVGCGRIFYFGLLAVIAGWIALTMFQMGGP